MFNEKFYINQTIIILIAVLFGLTTQSALAQNIIKVINTPDFNCSDGECDFQAALDTAQNNGKHDILMLGPGDYNSSSPFIYNTNNSPENFPVEIIGSGKQVTFINAGLDILAFGGTNSDITVRDVTIRNGLYASGEGGMNVARSEFIKGSLSDVPGLSANMVETLNIEDTDFIGNSSEVGAACNIASGQTINFSRNNVINNYAALKAACFMFSSVVNVTGNTFSGNYSNGNCGGFGISANTVNFKDNIVNGNTALGGDGGGGCFFSAYALINLTNNTFAFNNADGSGGGFKAEIWGDLSETIAFNNIFWGNTADNIGDDAFINNDVDSNGTGSPVTISHKNALQISIPKIKVSLN